MDQLSILLSPEEKAYGMIEDTLADTLYRNGLDKSFLTFESRRSFYSILFDKNIIVARFISTPRISLSVPTAILTSSDAYCSMADNHGNAYTKIALSRWEDISKYADLLSVVLQGIIDRIPKDYDCCSRYEECSDAKRCIHPDKKFSLKCGYRKILRSGRVFYGTNRNID